MKALILVVLGILLLVPAAILDGLAVMYLWQWFVVPVFQLPVLGLVPAIGFSYLAGLLTHQHIPRDEEGKRELLIHNYIAPIICLGMGYIIHLFM